MGTECPKCHTNNPDSKKFCGDCGISLDIDISQTRTIETPSEEFSTGSLFAGRYQIIEELGRGGMGRVYRVLDKELNEEIAMKLIRPEISAEKRTIERFKRELKLARKISHKNVGRMFELMESDGKRFITMEYVSGGDLKRFIRKSKQLTVDTAISIAMQICEGLSEAHNLGIVHRDLKPSNIMIEDNGDARIMDFGIARSIKGKDITGTGVMIGTPEYMSPEQVEGKEVDQRSDIYSLGIILYEMLTGRRPFEGDTAFAVGVKQKSEIPEEPIQFNPRIPQDLNRLILKCLEKEKEVRFQTSSELHNYLIQQKKDISTGRSDILESDTSREKRKYLLKKIAVGVTSAALAIILLLAAIIFLPKFYSRRDVYRIPRLINVRALTRLPGNETQPTWSPDGQVVAFVTEISGSKDVWVKRIGGGDALQVTKDSFDNFDPDWSPDGNSIVFRSNRKNEGLYIIPPLGGDATRICNFGYRPKWSPDGKKILFQLRDRGLLPNEIYVLDYPIIAPPYKFLEYVEGKDPFLYADWSPDGKYVVYKTGDYIAGPGFAISPLDLSGTPNFLEPDENKINGVSPVWVSHGFGIIYDRGSLYYLPLDKNRKAAQAAFQLTTGGDNTPALTVDGKSLAYNSSNSQADIWKVRLDLSTGKPTGQPIEIINNPSDDYLPKVLPDNKHFLFISTRDNGRFLYVADLDGQNVRLVDKTQNWRSLRSVSPNGKWIVLWDSNINTFLLPFDPASQESLGASIKIADVACSNWSADGRYLMGHGPVEESGTAIIALEISDEGKPKQISWPFKPEFVQDYPYGGYSYFSPDGEWIAFAAYKERHKSSIFVVKRGSDNPQLVFEGSGFPFWMTDMERIHMWSERGDETANKFGFVRFDPQTGMPLGDFEPIELKPENGHPELYHCAMTSDRKWLLFAFREVEGDIYIGDLSYNK